MFSGECHQIDGLDREAILSLTQKLRDLPNKAHFNRVYCLDFIYFLLEFKLSYK